MAEPSKHPLKFDCIKCGKESTYPNYLKAGQDKNAVQYVIKKCTTCGTDNKVDIPDGWGTDRTGVVHRGE